MGSIASPRFYVYILARPDGRPFYIGKGSRSDRRYAHELEARRGHKCPKCSVIRKVWQHGGQVIGYTVLTTDDESEAFAYERELIALYGRDTLTNLTDGGDGFAGGTFSDEVRAAISARVTAFFKDPVNRERVSTSLKARLASPAERERISRTVKARLSDPVAREEHRQRMIIANAAPETKQKHSQNGRLRYSDPNERAKQSDRIRAQWQDPEIRAKRTAGVRKSNADPEVRAKISASMKAYRARLKEERNGD